MLRPIFAMLLLLTTCAVLSILAAPAPRSAWERPIDPDHDCKFHIKGTEVIIEVPGTDHDLDLKRKRFNAPRVLRDVEGDFVMQVRVRASFRPSDKSSVEGEEPRVAAGLLLMPFEKTYARLDYQGWRRKGKLIHGFCQRIHGEHLGVTGENAGWGPSDWVPNEDHLYLRVEREGEWIRHAISPDGKKWGSQVSWNENKLPRKIKAGLAACSTSTEPFKVHFDQFQLIQGEQKSK